MRPHALRSILATLLVLMALLSLGFSAGGPPSRTGALAVAGVAAEPSCGLCHSGGFSAKMEILDLPAFYAPDSVYSLRVRLTRGSLPATGLTRGGFQLTTVRKTDGQGVGDFDITGTNGMVVVSGSAPYASRRYVQHLSTRVSSGQVVEWAFRWHAPSTDQGRVYFFGSCVHADGNSGPSLDLAVVARDSVESISVLGAPDLTGVRGDLLHAPVPNPTRGPASLSFSLAQAGNVQLAVFDAQGRHVRTLVSGWTPAGAGRATWDGRREDGSAAGPGVYWAQLRLAGERSPRPQRILLAR